MDYYDELFRAFAAPLEQQKKKLAAAYEREREQFKEDNAKQLQQAFLRNKIETRDLPGLLSSLGYHGGLAETAAADLSRRYSGNRERLNQQLDKALSELTLRNREDIGNIEAKLSAKRAELNAGRLLSQMKAETPDMPKASTSSRSPGNSSGGGSQKSKAVGYTTVTTPYAVIRRWYDKNGKFLFETYEENPAAAKTPSSAGFGTPSR